MEETKTTITLETGERVHFTDKERITRLCEIDINTSTPSRSAPGNYLIHDGKLVKIVAVESHSYATEAAQ